MGSCLSIVDDAVNDLLDQQSRYYKESKNAKDYAKESAQKTNENNVESSHLSAVLKSDLSPIYPSLPKAAKKFHCRNVYDGDTLTLENGNRVRLVGIDTPELKEKQPFAVEAKEYTKKYCHGKDIWLTFDQEDESSNLDHYGRLLAFVWVDLGGQHAKGYSNAQWLCINEGLVASGLAYAYSPSNTKKVHNYDKMLGLQKLARQHKCGQWKAYQDAQVIVTTNGSAFHKCRDVGSMATDCKHLARSKHLKLIPASEAYDKGLHPCRNCMG
ncbi:hypothetical protein ACHAW6_014470 [Cyclotella cf. meneghiniana]